MSSDFKITEYGRISSSFISAKLSEVSSADFGIQTGPFGSQLHKSDYVELGTPIITVEHLGDNHIRHENTPYVSDADKERLSKYTLREGDIVFSRVGSVDRRALVKAEEEGWLFSGRCLRVRPDPFKIDAVYLSYFMGLQTFKEHIRSLAVGATMPSINTKILSDLPIYFPSDLKVQKKIGEILQSIDDKIQLNSKINQTLEQMAQAIFKSWFVDFEPVKAKIAALEAGGSEEDALLAAMQAISGEDAAQLAQLKADHPEQYTELRITAELFPSAMQDSELGEIPEGWTVSKIEAIVERLKSKKRYSKNEVLANGSTPVYEQGANIILGYHNDKPSFHANADAPLFIFGDHTCITHISCQDFDISQNVITLKGRERPTIWTYFAVQGKQTFQEYRRHWSEFIIKPVILPSVELCEKYSKIVSKFLTISENLGQENISLSSLRDELLPKLLSGELEI